MFDGQVEIHFPAGIRNIQGYSTEDLATFNVDEEYEIQEGITLKRGDYPVTEIGGELVILVDII